MYDSSIPVDKMDQLLREALKKTYRNNEGVFSNESDFKMELYHNLAKLEYSGTHLSQKMLGQRTAALHAEGKCENGNAAKADILICNPTKFQKFNYEVDYIFELKLKLSRKDLLGEIKKIRSYDKHYKKIYIISAHRSSILMEQFEDDLNDIGQNIEIIQPPADIQGRFDPPVSETDTDEILSVLHDCIERCLMLYGNGKQQFQGFFWCNYEHELNKRQTYPCEGDFVCQLYHMLKTRLPSSVEVASEVKPDGSRNRIDLVLFSKNSDWNIPIDVKMNWDQFKHKYDQKTGIVKTAEAELILRRYEAISNHSNSLQRITIVIQWHLAQGTDKKSRSLKIFQAAEFRHIIVGYDENLGEVIWKSFGPPDK